MGNLLYSIRPSIAAWSDILDSSSNTSTALESKIKRDLATLLYEQGYNACAVVMVACGALAFATNNLQPTVTMLVWWALSSTLALVRMIDVYYWKKNVKGTAFDGQAYINRFSIPSIASAFSLGIFPYIAYPELDYIGRSIIIYILAGMAGGATALLSTDRRLAITYVFCLLIPASLLAIFRPEYNIRAVGVLGIFYWAILVMSINRTARFIHQSADLHHHNEELLEAIGEEKNLVESSNKKLKKAYEEINSANEVLEQKVELRTQALTIMASTDELTGLKNRHTFVKTLNDSIEKSKNKNEMFSILFVDLDGFKEINDIRGHITGDKVLKTIASRLKRSVKNKDFLCRWGGDEFVLVIEEHEPLLLDTISTRVCQTIQQEINIDFDHIKITASIGIATYPTHGTTTTELVNAADVAMYELKKGGKNGTLLFESAFLEKIRFEQHLLSGLNHAIQNQEFELYYQPMIPCKDSGVIMFEGLIRWKFEEAQIPPVIFIPIAESGDTIFDIGNWIIQKACQDISKNYLGSACRVSINISVKQLLNRGFVDFVDRCLKNNQVEPWRLQIEITESVFANNLNHANTVLSRLRDMGLTIALDDFGCGFSSLSYLQSLPIDTIKIDKSFVHQINAGGAKIIEATISIAEAFGCSVIAEGIESEEQYQKVKALGADYLQGFYLAKPSLHRDIDDCLIADEVRRQHLPKI